VRTSIKYILIVCAFLLSFNSKAQYNSIPETPQAFGPAIDTLLKKVNNEHALEVGGRFGVIWPALGPDIKKKIIEQTLLMADNKVRIYPHLTQYFHTIVNAVEYEGVQNQQFNQYLNMTAKVLETFEQKKFLDFLKTMTLFFEHHALFYNQAKKVYVLDDSYSFEFIESQWGSPLDNFSEASGDDYYDEPYEESYDDTVYDDEYQDNYDDEPYQESYDNYDENYPEESYVYEPDLLELRKPVIELPEPSGPIIRFEKATLNFSTFYDSAFLEGTSGFFSLEEKAFTGSGGKFDWTTAGLDNTVYAELSKYTFAVDKFELKAWDAILTYPDKLEEPVEGIFEFKSVRHDSLIAPRYPGFLSYRSGHVIKGFNDEKMGFKGGISLTGAHLQSANFLKENAVLTANANDVNKVIVRSPVFNLGDSVISTKSGRMSIIHRRDSIFHPAVEIDFNKNAHLLSVDRHDGNFKDTPYYSSYFNVNFRTEIIKWDLNTDTLNVFMRQAKRVDPMVVESEDHFEKIDYIRLGSIYDFHPLGVIASYAKKINSERMSISQVAAEYGIQNDIFKGAMQLLKYKGLVEMDEERDELILKKGGVMLYDANFERIDYDDMILESLMDEQPDYPNASIYLNEGRMDLRGVEYLSMSDSLNIEMFPDSSVVTFLKGRDVEFSGRLVAGNFEYFGHQFTFKYDSFLVHMQAIDSVQFYVQDEFGNRKKIDNSMVGVDSAAAQTASLMPGASKTAGTLYLNEPGNKSGKAHNPHYPNFTAGMGAVFYFDRKEIFNGNYDKSLFFVVPPFEIDSLGDSNPASIVFEGVFSSSGMFPDFDENLRYQPDNTMGFNHFVPEEGYQLYEGAGRLYGDLRMNKKGLRSTGRIDFLSSTLISDEFIFYQDSVTGEGLNANIEEEEHSGVIFPQANLANFRMKWLPQKDSMYVSNIADPFQFYNGTASLDGTAIISNSGVFGSGRLISRGSIATSERLTFRHNSYAARNADFIVESNNPEKPALAGTDVRLNFNLDQNFADISPEIEGEAAVEFPYAQYKTSIPTARWDLNEQKIYMAKPDNVPIENSYFYTTNDDLDSLRFNATSAVYDIERQELKVSGIPYIVVADALITPENNEVLIHENSRLETLYNTTIILDTLTGYHRLYDGVINVGSRNMFSGHATYELVNALGDTFAIKMENFRLEEFPEDEGRNLTSKLHTVANGEIAEDDNILISPGMFYKGDVKMVSHNPMLGLNGYIRLNLTKNQYDDIWIGYNHDADNKKIAIDFDNSTTEEGRIIEAGLYFSTLDNDMYALFIDLPRSPDDEVFFRPGGMLFYDEDNNEFVIEDPAKTSGESYAGKVFTYNEESGDIRLEGPVQFFENNRGAQFQSALIGRGNTETGIFNLNALLTIDFNIHRQIYDAMAFDLEAVIKNLGAPEGLGDPTELLYKLAEIIGDKAAKQYEERTLVENTPLAGFSPEITKPMVFTDVNIKWSTDYKAFYSEGLLGMSNVLGYNVNGAFEGFMELRKNEDGTPVFNLFYKASADSWYFFGYEDNRLLLYSSNQEFNNIVKKRTNASKAKIGELVFVPGDEAETLSFINRFREQYYGITVSYQLSAEAELNEEEKEKEKTDDGDDDDGF